ncbi:MAG TPA: hypothetical protein VLH60_02255 [Sedimentisphaerales bacterium]|nr:hypothetical protein [Sedimentisphaerales bacterium]
MQFTETDIDRILDSVEAALAKTEALAKSDSAAAANGGQIKSGLKKDDMIPPEKPEGEVPAEQAPEAAAPEAPAPEAAAEAPAEPPAAEAPAPEAPAEGEAQPPAEGEEALEGEGEAPLSDEELHEIYGSMEPAELERHFMMIRSLLQDMYAKEAPAPGAEAPAPAPEAPAPEAPAPEQAMKSETSELAQLKAEHEQLKKSLEGVVKAMEATISAPQRKAITEIAFLDKSEGGKEETLTREQILPILNEKSRSASLSKTERDAINDYLLTGGSKEKIAAIVKTK